MTKWIYGKNVIKQSLMDSDRVKQIYMSSNDEQIVTLARKKNVPVKHMDRQALTRLVHSENHQGAVAEIAEYRTYSLEELTANVSGNGLLVVLDDLEDPHNLGAILRSCDAAGADGVIYPKRNSVGLTPTVAKVSAGAIETVRCCEVTNVVRTLQLLKKQGWWVVGTDMDGQDYRSLDYDRNIVLVIGNEGKGISRLVGEECDYMASIPMVGKISSLNASVSAGILLYEVFAKRHPL